MRMIVRYSGRPCNAEYCIKKITNFADAIMCTSGTFNAAQMPAFTGDATSSAGSSALTLANSGVVAGTYPKLVVDAKGRVTSGAALVAADIPNLN